MKTSKKIASIKALKQAISNKYAKNELDIADLKNIAYMCLNAENLTLKDTCNAFLLLQSKYKKEKDIKLLRLQFIKVLKNYKLI